ncbi:MAG: hypothetical protein JWN82_168 [Candidatus Saccharibacteria bacterium]|nr:hypothetical protein [Candidatus Saccharibacteria bacterium]
MVVSLEACALEDVEQALRKAGFDKRADAVGFVNNLAQAQRHSIGYEHDLPDARRLAKRVNLPCEAATRYTEAYQILQMSHAERLGGAARMVTRFLLKNPNVLYMPGDSPDDREPVVKLEFVPEELQPHEEAYLAIHGLRGAIPNLSARGVVGNVTKFKSTEVLEKIIPILIAEPREMS